MHISARSSTATDLSDKWYLESISLTLTAITRERAWHLLTKGDERNGQWTTEGIREGRKGEEEEWAQGAAAASVLCHF